MKPGDCVTVTCFFSAERVKTTSTFRSLTARDLTNLSHISKIIRFSCGVQHNLNLDVAKQFFVKLCNFRKFLKTPEVPTFEKIQSRIILLGNIFVFSSCQDK